MRATIELEVHQLDGHYPGDGRKFIPMVLESYHPKTLVWIHVGDHSYGVSGAELLEAVSHLPAVKGRRK